MNKKESDHLYYLKHKEQIKERVKRYAEEHKDEIKVKQKLAFQKRKEKRKAECKFTVYLRTNKVNGKQYVGQTENFEGRENDWACLSQNYANKIISIDREKYGLENFDVEILAVVDTREKAWELERKYILERNTKYPNGYNIADGGGGSTRIEPWNKGVINCYSEETINKMSEVKKGKHNCNEFRKGHEPWNKGKHTMTDAMKKHLSKMLTNGKTSKVVIQKKPNGNIIEWASNKECKRNGYTNIYLYCNGKNNHIFKGDEWYYKSDYEEMLAEQAN